MGWFMKLRVRHITLLALVLGFSTSVFAEDMKNPVQFYELDLNSIELLAPSAPIAANSNKTTTYRSSVPNIPDSAFAKPGLTENNIHQYLGMASMALGVITGLSAPEDGQTNLKNTVHYKAANAAWQLGAAAVGTGLYAHWDDFHLADGWLDRDNLHALLGLAGTLGYYWAVQSALDEYNKRDAAGNPGSVSENHASKGIFGGAAMLTAIVITW